MERGATWWRNGGDGTSVDQNPVLLWRGCGLSFFVASCLRSATLCVVPPPESSQRAVKPILMGKDCIAQAQSGERRDGPCITISLILPSLVFGCELTQFFPRSNGTPNLKHESCCRGGYLCLVLLSYCTTWSGGKPPAEGFNRIRCQHTPPPVAVVSARVVISNAANTSPHRLCISIGVFILWKKLPVTHGPRVVPMRCVAPHN